MGCNDPAHREEFLAWLTDRVEKAGESVVDPPWKFKAALASGNPKDLKADVWREWYDHMNPGWEDAAKAAGGFEEPPSSIGRISQIDQSIGASQVRHTKVQEVADTPKPEPRTVALTAGTSEAIIRVSLARAGHRQVSGNSPDI